MGSREYAVAKSERTQDVCRTTSLAPAKTWLMWIDGVLDTQRIASLLAEPGVYSVVQYDHYVVAKFSSHTQRNGYRYLDPHHFVVQIDSGCTELAINFNPPPEQVGKLREFKAKFLTKRLEL